MATERSIQRLLTQFDEMQFAMRTLERERAEKEERAIPASTRKRLARIKEEYQNRVEVIQFQLTQLEKDIKEQTLEYGESVKGDAYFSVYNKGRVSWNTVGLDGYALAHPEIAEFRKMSDPYITLKKV